MWLHLKEKGFIIGDYKMIEEAKMNAIKYIAKVLPDGHLSLPEEIKEKMGLAANSRVKVVLAREAQREKAIEAFSAWSERSDIKDGIITAESAKHAEF